MIWERGGLVQGGTYKKKKGGGGEITEIFYGNSRCAKVNANHDIGALVVHLGLL
jgi:hypothetical protein